MLLIEFSCMFSWLYWCFITLNDFRCIYILLCSVLRGLVLLIYWGEYCTFYCIDFCAFLVLFIIYLCCRIWFMFSCVGFMVLLSFCGDFRCFPQCCQVSFVFNFSFCDRLDFLILFSLCAVFPHSFWPLLQFYRLYCLGSFLFGYYLIVVWCFWVFLFFLFFFLLYLPVSLTIPLYSFLLCCFLSCCECLFEGCLSSFFFCGEWSVCVCFSF